MRAVEAQLATNGSQTDAMPNKLLQDAQDQDERAAVPDLPCIKFGGSCGGICCAAFSQRHTLTLKGQLRDLVIEDIQSLQK